MRQKRSDGLTQLLPRSWFPLSGDFFNQFSILKFQEKNRKLLTKITEHIEREVSILRVVYAAVRGISKYVTPK